MNATATTTATPQPAAPRPATAVRFTADRKALLAALRLVGKACPKKSPKPILRNVLIAANRSGASLTTTDLDTSATVAVEPAESDRPGELLVDCARLTKICRESKSATLSVESDGQRVTLRADTVTLTLPAPPPAKFPRTDATGWNAAIDIDAGELCRALRQTLPATDPESSRYALGGVLLDVAGDAVALVATDGRRAHVAAPLVESVESGEAFGSVTRPDVDRTVVPVAALKIVEQALRKSADVVTIARARHTVRFSAPGVVVWSRLMEGRFPAWRDVFPQRLASESGRVVWSAAAGPLGERFAEAALAVSDESRGVRVVVDGPNGAASFCGASGEAGASLATCWIDPPEVGPELVSEVELNPEYFTGKKRGLLAALDPSAVVSLDWVAGDPQRDGAPRGVDSAVVVDCPAERFRAVVMPLARRR